MLCGGNPWRLTPIYYKYGLPGSYDDNWGFELMWGPMDDIQQGRGLALYYSNMGCNVPIYTHINLSGDNAHCLMLWWYVSTCRHLGIGGKHPDAKIVAAQQQAMRWYRARDRFYKRGDFYGIDEEIHLHVLPAEEGVCRQPVQPQRQDANHQRPDRPEDARAGCGDAITFRPTAWGQSKMAATA